MLDKEIHTTALGITPGDVHFSLGLMDDQHYYCETHQGSADIIGITLQDSKERPLVAVSPTELCKILPMITFTRRSDISWLINHVIGDGKLY